MPKVLTEEQIEFFNREGYLYPVEGISKQRCDELLGALDDFEIFEPRLLNDGDAHGCFLNPLGGAATRSPRPYARCAAGTEC